MSNADQSVDTAHGRLDRAALEKARDSYDTMSLLRTIDEFDELVREGCGEEGLRDLLLRLHAMTHTVVNGAALSVSTDHETLPELADEVVQLHDAIAMLQSWIRRIEPLKALEPRD